MEEKLADLREGLNKQLDELTDSIQSTESQLLIYKERYLKVQGALELLTIVQTYQKDVEAFVLSNV